MSTESKTSKIDWSSWLSWIGIVVALIGFFLIYPIILGIVGAVLGIVSLWGKDRIWASIAIIVGIIVLILALLEYTVTSSPMM